MSNGRLGLRTRPGLIRSYTQGINVPDADADAFIVAAGITDQTQINAISQLVADLKGYAIWSKMKAIYPFVGGTASTHKWNLKDPRDLDVAFRLVFTGGWTHTNNGALPNGTTAYANTYLNPSVNLTSPSHLSYYTGTNANTGSDQIDIGITNFWLSLWYNGSGFNNMLGRNQSGSVLLNGGAVTNSQGFGIITKIGTTAKLFMNNSQKTSVTDTTTTYQNYNITIGVLNTGSFLYYSNRDCRFASIGDGLTDTEAANLYTSVQDFQTTLGRQV